MFAAPTLRHQFLELLAQDLLPAVAEQLLNLGVHHDNLPALVHNYYRIGRGFQQPAELCLRPPLLGDIDPGSNDVSWRLLGAGQDRGRPRDDSLFAVASDPAAFVFGSRLGVANLVEQVSELPGFLRDHEKVPYAPASGFLDRIARH